MKRQNLYLSTVDPQAHLLAGQHGLGLEFAEFCTAWNLDDEFPATDAAVRRKMTCTDRFTIHGPFTELHPGAIDRRARELARFRFLQTIETAADYGIRKIVLHGGYLPRVYFPVWYTEQSALFWKDLLRDIPEEMTICVENVLEDTPEMIADIIRQVADPRLRMTLDVGHAHVYSRVPAAEWIRRCADVIDHYHIHNNDGARDDHQSLFQGTIPMEPLFDLVSTLTPQATVTLELPEAAPSIRWLRDKNILEDFL